jgi:hypothetical protein
VIVQVVAGDATVQNAVGVVAVEGEYAPTV